VPLDPCGFLFTDNPLAFLFLGTLPPPLELVPRLLLERWLSPSPYPPSFRSREMILRSPRTFFRCFSPREDPACTVVLSSYSREFPLRSSPILLPRFKHRGIESGGVPFLLLLIFQSLFADFSFSVFYVSRAAVLLLFCGGLGYLRVSGRRCFFSLFPVLVSGGDLVGDFFAILRWVNPLPLT